MFCFVVIRIRAQWRAFMSLYRPQESVQPRKLAMNLVNLRCSFRPATIKYLSTIPTASDTSIKTSQGVYELPNCSYLDLGVESYNIRPVRSTPGKTQSIHIHTYSIRAEHILYH